MKHILLFLLFFCFMNGFVKAQFVDNIQTFGSKYGERITKVLHDKEDNRYVLGVIGHPSTTEGYVAEMINFGNIKQVVRAGFVAKFDKDNRCLWVKEAPYSGSPIDNSYNDFAVDDAGFVYTTGYMNYKNFVLQKLDRNGVLMWEKKYKAKEWKHPFRGEAIAVDKQGNVLVVGLFDGADIEGHKFNFNGESTSFLTKFSADGELLWIKTFLEDKIYYTDILIDSEDNIITSGGFLDKINIDGHVLENNSPSTSYGPLKDRFIIKRDPDGKIVWSKGYPLEINNAPSLILDKENNIYLTAEVSYENRKSIVIDGVLIDKSKDKVLVKLGHEGSVKWSTSFSCSNTYLSLVNAENSIYLAGDYFNGFKIKDKVLQNSQRGSDIFLANLSLDGEVKGLNRFEGAHPRITFLPNKKEVVLGALFSNPLTVNGRSIVSKGEIDIYLAQIPDTLNAASLQSTIRGRLFVDRNSNCIVEPGEKGLANTLLKVEPGAFYALSDEQGNYSIKVPFGNYYVIPLNRSSSKTQIIQACTTSIPVSTDSLHKEATNINFGYNIIECSQLTVDIAADRRRRCMQSYTTVTYTNEGTADAQNVKIKVIYPEYVVPISSTLPWTARQDSALVFDIGMLKAGERKSFVITDSTICGNEAIRGLSQCVKATITPKNTCVAPNQAWDHASVVLAANFTNQEKTAEFTILNEGAGDMADSTAYRVFSNTALVKQGKVKLKKGTAATLEVPAQAATLRLEADQVVNHPGQSRPTISILPPASLLNLPSMAVPTSIDAFYQDDADAEVDISCLEIVDSFDPNDKQVSPQGITKRGYIKAEDELEYLIRFQNTGTDVAYNVVVKDTINDYLDIASLRVGSASHPFTYTVSGQGKPVVTFTFKNINLPDHKTNEPGSHGYIKFSIAQKPDNPKGTVIKNTAYNYFDFNSPIATNEVVNRIGDTLLVLPQPLAVYDCGVEEPSIAQAGADVNLCEGEINRVTLHANVPQKGIGHWKIISGQATLVDPANPQSALQDIGYGEMVLEWTIALCRKTSSSQIKINRYRIPLAPEVAVLPLQCEGSVLLPLKASGENITWYQDSEKQRKLFTGNAYTPVVATTTTFYATQTVNGCESPVKAVVVSIQPKQITVTVNADTLLAPQADTYQWFFNDKPLKAETNQRLVIKNSGRYRVQTLVNGCASASENLEHIINVPQAQLKLSPNPVQEELLIELTSNATGNGEIIIRDYLGKQMMRFTHQKTYTISERKLNLTSLTPGMYFLEVRIGKEVTKKKFIKL